MLANDGCVSPTSETSDDTTSSEDAHSPKINASMQEGDPTKSGVDENQSENVLVIDTTFTCKIIAPGMDPFEIKVHNVLKSWMMNLK